MYCLSFPFAQPILPCLEVKSFQIPCGSVLGSQFCPFVEKLSHLQVTTLFKPLATHFQPIEHTYTLLSNAVYTFKFHATLATSFMKQGSEQFSKLHSKTQTLKPGQRAMQPLGRLPRQPIAGPLETFSPRD